LVSTLKQLSIASKIFEKVSQLGPSRTKFINGIDGMPRVNLGFFYLKNNNFLNAF